MFCLHIAFLRAGIPVWVANLQQLVRLTMPTGDCNGALAWCNECQLSLVHPGEIKQARDISSASLRFQYVAHGPIQFTACEELKQQCIDHHLITQPCGGPEQRRYFSIYDDGAVVVYVVLIQQAVENFGFVAWTLFGRSLCLLVVSPSVCLMSSPVRYNLASIQHCAVSEKFCAVHSDHSAANGFPYQL